MKIADVVHPNESGEFIQDVQLRWYVEGDTENLALAKRYIFTRTSSGERKSPIDILYTVREALLTSRENRFTVIATYGHGKSHLALALANFFGKRVGSPEVKAVMKSIQSAFTGDPEAEAYTDFKKERKRQLVVCIEGTTPGDLASLFLVALQRALANEPETKKARMPFWTEAALPIVERMEAEPAAKAKASAFLKQHGSTLPDLKARLDGKDVTLYDVVRELCQHVHGYLPDLGGHVSLVKAVKWVAETFCGPEDDKPFGGMLLLFDEFSAFVRNYSIRRTPGTPLQDLLDGVSGQKGKVVFVAFGQSDPNDTVFSVFADRPDEQLKSALLLELERLPKRFRFQLYTTMESVLDAYLSQDGAKFRAALDKANAWPAITEANDDCLTLFRRRYEQELQWDGEKVQEVITLGTFPLHPLTTSLLCNVQLLESANPRSVLGFVSQQTEQIGNAPIAKDGMPSWVRATHLVDWFGKQLADDEWKRYEEAVRQRGGDATPTEEAVLKAMLLHFVAGLPTGQVSYNRTLAQLTGLPQAEVATTLKTLADVAIIEHVAASKKYAFWPLGGGGRELQDRINKRMSGRTMTWEQWRDVNADAGELGLGVLPISVSWGHQDDWAAPQFYLPHEHASPEAVRELAEKAPGCVIWCVAREDAGVEWFDENANSLFAGLRDSNPPPVVLMCPSRPSPLLIQALFRDQVLKALPQEEVLLYGQNTLETMRTQTRATIRSEARVLVEGQHRYLLPNAYAAALRVPKPPETLAGVIHRLFTIAYSSAPVAFFTHYKRGSANLRNAVTLLCKLLMKNEVHVGSYEANKVAMGTIENYLAVGKPTTWGLLSTERRLQEPGAQRIADAWNLLSKQIPANSKEAALSSAIATLRRAPFGYDANTLSLLFCAWYGYHRHDLSMSVGGALEDVDELLKQVENGPAKFADFLAQSPIRLSRKDRSAAVTEVRKIIERSRQLWANPLTKAEARESITRVDQYIADDRNQDQSERKQAEESRSAIRSALEQTLKYDQEASTLLAEADKHKDVPVLVRLLGKTSELPECGGVVPDQPRIDAIRENLERRLSETLEAFCQEQESLSQLTRYQASHDQLRHVKSSLEEYVGLQERVTTALDRLDKAKEALEANERDRSVLRALEVIPTKGPLAQLRVSLRRVTEMECVSDQSKEAQGSKTAELRQAIAELEAFAASAEGKIAAVGSHRQLREVRSELARQSALLAETDEARLVDMAIARFDALDTFFGALAGLRVNGFASRPELEQITKELDELGVHYEDVLGQPQQAAISEAREKVAIREKALEAEATRWLDEVEAEVRRTNNPNRLMARLANAPQFLTEEGRTRLRQVDAQLRDHLEQDRKQEEAREQEKSVLRTLDAISPKGPLVQLRRGLELVQGIVSASPRVQVEQAKKREVLGNAKTELESFAAGLRARLDSVASSDDLNRLRTVINQKEVFFDGSPEMSLIENALARCGAIADLVKDLAAIGASPLDTPDSYQSCVQRLAKLKESYAGRVSQEQVSLVTTAEEALRVRVQGLEEKALQWLADARRRFTEGCDLSSLLDTLSSPPAFLPARSQSALDGLRTEVRTTQEKDICGQVRSLFGKITDRSVREQLVEELRALLGSQP